MHRPRAALNSWVVAPRPHPEARLRLFCFPYAGGGASIYYAWPRGLPASVEVCAVQLPGRESRLAETPYADLGALVAKLGEELRPWMDRPFAFFGHSNGALMAFELCRLLRREGRPLPVRLIASGRPAPQLPLDEPPVYDLPEDRFVARLRELSGTPEEVLQNPEIMALLVPLLRADFSLAETYAYPEEPPLDLPLSAYGGERDDEVSADEVEAWGAQTTGAFRVRMFPGDHFFLNADRDLVLREVAAELALDVARLDGHA